MPIESLEPIEPIEPIENELPLPSVAGIEAAYQALDPLFRDTALFNHPAADDALGHRLSLKVESLNSTRAFKGRGTDWFMQAHGADPRPLVAASAGNFGQGLALAARKHSRSLIMFASINASALKIEAMRRFGARIIQSGADFDAAKLAAQAYAHDNKCQFVEDGADPRIAEGAGTMALEMTRTGQRFDTLLVPLGNGSLLTGIGTWYKAKAATTHVIGIVAETSPAMLRSFQAGHAIATPAAPTIADGIAVREPVAYALRSMVGTVDDVWTVSEANIRLAMRFCHQHYGLMAEPAGAAGIGAALEHRARLQGQSVGTILCGSNLTLAQVKEYLG